MKKIVGSVKRRQQFDVFHALMKEIKVEDPRTFAKFVRMDTQQFHYFLNLHSTDSSRRIRLAVLLVHSKPCVNVG